MNLNYEDAEKFAKLLKSANINGKLSIGKFILEGRKGVNGSIQYNERDFDLLDNEHEYTFPVLKGELQVSIQLYENLNFHYRLFCFTKINGKVGLTFSVNLTTEKESEEVIYLTQKIKFAERYKGDSNLAQAHRRQKQRVFCELLSKLNLDVTESNDIILGIFDPTREQFVNTTPDKFLNDFLVVSLLKGHFQGNKGYQLEILPAFNSAEYSYAGMDDEIEAIPLKIKESKTKRNIPLGLRYRILKRDGFKCVACGYGPKDDVKLHIDHKIPYSLGGITIVENLQTLCSDCNISKSNKFVD
jgi:hypothetical protein